MKAQALPIAFLTWALLAVPLAGQAEPDLTGTWEGTLTIPSGAQVTVIFRIESAAEGWDATWDSPDQGAVGLPAGTPVLQEGELTIPLPVIQGRYAGTLNPAGTAIDGTFHQGAAQLPLELRRTSVRSGRMERPQEPEAPYPYQVDEVRFDNPRASGVTLAGTLTLPHGPGPFPAVVLISGSGPQDRDEALFGHKPFLVLADHLTRNGIAVLRFDDRGVAESTGVFALATSLDFATDVQAAVDYLVGRPEVGRNKIGLIGHSEGGLIAPLVANESADVGFVVLMAGPGLPGDQILLLQSELIGRADRANEAGIQLNQETQRALFAILKATEDPAFVHDDVRAVLEQAVQKLESMDAGAAADQRAQIPAQLAQVTSPWFHWFLKHDPAVPLRRMRQPVLAINGAKDLQVPSSANLSAIRSALVTAGNMDVTTHEFDGLNHLFQNAKTGAPSEYAAITETLSPRVLQVISGWILERTNSDNN